MSVERKDQIDLFKKDRKAELLQKGKRGEEYLKEVFTKCNGIKA